MITAELNHNPYLLLTKVKFNGQEPRINSQIEKYEHLPLKDWADKVPAIFYNEMNGYDFELHFIGTKSDFEEVQKSFTDAGVTEEEVRLFYRNEIEDANKKSEEIDDLLAWMKEHPNRRFDFEEFWANHREIFEGTYPYIIVNGSVLNIPDSSISVESIKDAEELDNTDLSSTPILFHIDEQTKDQFRKDLNLILNRKDVCSGQLFFLIDSTLDVAQMTRVISDLGVKRPKVVGRYDDDAVLKYVRNYPMTEYIRKVISIFESNTIWLSEILEKENKASEVLNSEIHKMIDKLEEELVSLREADDFFVQRDYYNIPSEFIETKNNFMIQVRKWQNRKTKIVGDAEAANYANEYQMYLEKHVADFARYLNRSYAAAGMKIKADFVAVYNQSAADCDFFPTEIGLTGDREILAPDLINSFTGLKKITYENSKSDFLGLFKISTEEPDTKVRVATCYLDEWRDKAIEELNPIIDDYISKRFEDLRIFYDNLAVAYHCHLAELIDKKMQEKDSVTAQLSDEEQKLQEDNDWLTEVKNQLQNIERG